MVQPETQPAAVPLLKAEGSLSLLVGVPGSGKTTLALKEASRLVVETGKPMMIVDSLATIDPQDSVVCRTVGDMIDGAYRDGRHVYYIPRGEEDVRRIAAAVLAAGNVILVVDEIALWASAHYTPESLESLIRTHRHKRVDLIFTTQYVGDVSPLVRNCASRVVGFRTTNPRAVKLLSEEYQFPADRLPTLGRGETVVWTRDFR